MKVPLPLLDVLCNVLFLVLFLNTLLAFSAVGESPERALPPIRLEEVKGATSPGVSRVASLTLSVRPVPGGEALAYFLNEAPVDLPQLEQKLKELAPREVLLRVDAQVRHGAVVSLMKFLEERGVPNISFAYRAK